MIELTAAKVVESLQPQSMTFARGGNDIVFKQVLFATLGRATVKERNFTIPPPLLALKVQSARASSAKSWNGSRFSATRRARRRSWRR